MGCTRESSAGLVGSKNTTLRSDSGSGSSAYEFSLTAKGAIVIGV